METKVNRANIMTHLIDKELEMVGKSRLDVLDDDKWYFNITMTRAQYKEYRVYSIKLIKKTFRCNTKKAEDTHLWFFSLFGLRLKD
jgi:hypothetical protein